MKKNNIFVWKNLYRRIFFLLFALFIFRVGSFIPIPGINVHVLEQFLIKKNNSIIEIFNTFSGGSLHRASIFALGVMPYISASIIVQLFTFLFSYFKDLKKDGEFGRIKLNQYTRYITLLLASVQSISLIIGLPYLPGMENIIFVSNFSFYMISILSLVTGTMFLMWLGELITERGLGNGVSLIICSSILSGLPYSVIQTLENFRIHSFSFLHIFFILLVIFFIIFFIVFFEGSIRKIFVFYSNRPLNKNMQILKNSTYLPLKINMAGVVPVIFSSSIVLFPAIILAYLVRIYPSNFVLLFLSISFQPNHYLYSFLYIFLIGFFCFFYTNLMFNSVDTANNLKKTGAYIQGIRPGYKTAEYIHNITIRLTFIGAIYTIFICLVPDIMRYFLHVPFYFGGTSLLIIVVVMMDFIAQVQTIIMSTKYTKILKKKKFFLKK